MRTGPGPSAAGSWWSSCASTPTGWGTASCCIACGTTQRLPLLPSARPAHPQPPGVLRLPGGAGRAGRSAGATRWPLSCDSLGENLGQYRRLEELEVLPSRPAAGVQLLTIHKSKGLEFPVVVLADTGNRGRAGLEKRP